MVLWIKRHWPDLAGLVVGVVVLILAGKIMGLELGEVQWDSITFGADYYTESYEAMAVTANNVNDLIQLVQTGFGYLLVALGLSDLCLFGSRAVKGLIHPNPVPQPQAAAGAMPQEQAPEGGAAYSPTDPGAGTSEQL